jgi:hypothetical protein
LRETGWGGIAVTPTGRAIAARLGLTSSPDDGAGGHGPDSE